MKKRFLSILTLSMSLIALTSCNRDNDDNFRAFMSTATITGDSINGYYCYLDVGGIVISYDQALQNPDTLLLQLYYNPNIPENWTNIKTDYGSVSCDISNLATLQNWNDSVTIVVKTGDNSKLLRKISKADFIKPGILYTH